MILGVAGKICAGKDQVVGMLEARGYRVIDMDVLGHKALVAKADAVAATFGTIDRRALGAIVFGDPEQLRRLEAIVHPWMVAEARRRLAAAPVGPWVINAAILYRLGLNADCDAVLWVTAPWWIRLRRCMRRDQRGFRAAWKRIWAQGTMNLEVHSGSADRYTIRNAVGIGALEARLRRVLERIGE